MKLSESTILVVDDDEDILLLAKKILEKSGAHILSTQDVSHAMEHLSRSTPHLIVTDLDMSPVSGFDFLKKIQDHKEWQTIPTIVLSALNDKNSVFEAISLGAVDYILKPIKANYFMKKIRKNLNDQEFLKYDFPPEDKPQVTTSTRGIVHSIGEIGLKMEMNVCFNSRAQLVLNSPSPLIPGFKQAKFIAHNRGTPLLKGLFVNELIAVPAGKAFIQLKRSLLK